MASPAIFHQVPVEWGIDLGSEHERYLAEKAREWRRPFPSGLWLSESEVFDAHVRLSQNVGIPCTMVYPILWP